MQHTEALEDAAWSFAFGIATTDQAVILDGDRPGWRASLERFLARVDEVLGDNGEVSDLRTTAHLIGVRMQLQDAIDELEELGDAPLVDPAEQVTAAPDPVVRESRRPALPDETPLPPAPVALQASWDGGRLVAWAAGRGSEPADFDELSDRLEAVGAPPHGWTAHRSVPLPTGEKAAALSIDMADALGWFVTLGAESGDNGVGPSAQWLGRVCLFAVDAVAQGRAVPTLRATKRGGGRSVDLNVSWAPAVLDSTEVRRLSSHMPGAVSPFGSTDARAIALSVMESVANAIVGQAARQVELPASPPTVRTTADVAEAVIAKLDGSKFVAPAASGTPIVTRMSAWARPVAGVARTRLITQLEPPDSSNAWLMTVLAKGPDGRDMSIQDALQGGKESAAVETELARLERMLPVLLRVRGKRRGEAALTQSEAWEFMTETGPMLQAAGFEVRVPALSRRKPTPALRLFAESTGPTAVGAAQLSDVRWSVVFDDVELTAAEVAKLAAQARPLVKSRGRWVELDRADLSEAAAALAEREAKTSLSGAEILRHAVGLEDSGLAGGVQVAGSSWATDILEKAQTVTLEPVTAPAGFHGELRSYQAEALSWLGFLDAVGLGGCLALDMGLGKTPTVLAHMAAAKNGRPALVIAPPAVVGNWAAEANRFTPDLSVVIHHGASRASAKEVEAELKDADLVITTYATAVRDIDALSSVEWDRVVLDEAQAIKNPASDTAQQLRRMQARSRIALTGTPIENGLGDLWSILDFTNPTLVGSRASFIAQLSGDGEKALRALNGILVFRRTKAEPFVKAELPDKIDELDHCTMTPEQIGLYQAVLDEVVNNTAGSSGSAKKGAILAAITRLKQICNHPVAYFDDGKPLHGRSGKLTRLEEILESVFAAEERIIVFTHFAEWGKKMADHLTEVTGVKIDCYHGGLARGARDRMIAEFQEGKGAGALVLSLKAGGTGLNLTAASHVVLYDRWWNPAVEDQARDRAWRIGQTRTVLSHRLVCPGTVDERVEEVVAGKRHIADVVLPKSSSLSDLDPEQLRVALGLRSDLLLTEESE